MGCVQSKLFRKDLRQETLFGNGGDCNTHVVSLTSSTYGVLNLDKKQPVKEFPVHSKRKSPPRQESPEVINAWELMEGLEEEAPISIPSKKSPKSRVLLRGFGGFDTRSPLKFLNQMASPKKLIRSGGGKENNGFVNRFKLNYSPEVSKKSLQSPLNLRSPVKSDRSGFDSGGLSRPRSLTPLFDPELLESFEKELSVEEEQIKNMVFSTPIPRRKKIYDSNYCDSILNLFEKKCPSRGENAIVIYTTTLRGIRKTFEDCNTVRKIVESHGIRVFERDVSMDSGFREELRGIMGKKEVKVPVVFVKGRLIGGAEQVVKLEEEGKLGILLDGIPSVASACDRCAGIRFVMCLECSGSCKVVGEDGRKSIKCGECNENGLIQCPICC